MDSELTTAADMTIKKNYIVFPDESVPFESQTIITRGKTACGSLYRFEAPRSFKGLSVLWRNEQRHVAKYSALRCR